MYSADIALRARAHDAAAVELLADADIVEAAATQHDDTLRELTHAIAPGRPIGRQAMKIAARLRRYQPSLIGSEGDDDRRVLHRISSTGLQAPSIRHLRRILSRL